MMSRSAMSGASDANLKAMTPPQSNPTIMTFLENKSQSQTLMSCHCDDRPILCIIFAQVLLPHGEAEVQHSLQYLV